MKRCWNCKIRKEIEYFGKLKSSKDGLRTECKECRNKKLRTGKPNTGRFKKGHVPLKPFMKGHKKGMTGKNHSNETKEKIRLKKKGIVLSPNSRTNVKAREWAMKVKERDKWMCRQCLATESLDAHHIIPWKIDEHLRYDLDNGLTLCRSCHAKTEGYQIGHTHSAEAREKMRKTRKGMIPWSKGKKFTDEHRKKLSLSHLGKKPWNFKG